ncbi:nicotinate ribosyltransferase [Gordonia phage Pupper]|uniref:Nicotinate ribosyltransferase n=1 Tax=Gordonia phage Pupper TaxID=2571249 RepID=A0A4Y6ET87_9CAUD|nr:nicotinate ribosyltransferase [Gordonia phage Pupper]QDF18494.1 nicotinate ribosyltransferase [Gordonia phage Pupper]
MTAKEGHMPNEVRVRLEMRYVEDPKNLGPSSMIYYYDPVTELHTSPLSGYETKDYESALSDLWRRIQLKQHMTMQLDELKADARAQEILPSEVSDQERMHNNLQRAHQVLNNGRPIGLVLGGLPQRDQRQSVEEIVYQIGQRIIDLQHLRRQALDYFGTCDRWVDGHSYDKCTLLRGHEGECAKNG